MLKDTVAKYRPFPGVHLPHRQWPSRTLTRAPIWCSVDLRDGNQALAVPMNVAQKLELFQALRALSGIGWQIAMKRKALPVQSAGHQRQQQR